MKRSGIGSKRRITYPRHTSLAAIIVTLILCSHLVSGCGGGGGGGGASPSPTPSPTATPTPAPAAPILTLTGDRTSILRGETVSLHWTSSNASDVTSSNFGANVVNGDVQVTPTSTTTYTLTVEGPGGAKTASFTIDVATVSVSISPSPGTVIINRSLPLVATIHGAVDKGASWAIQEASGGVIAADAAHPENATYTAPEHAGIYHIRAVSNADTSKSATVEINVQAASGTVMLN